MPVKPIARVGDTITGTCQAPVGGHPRTFTGTWVTGSPTCNINGISIVRVGDTGITDCGHHIVATGGSTNSTADGLAIHRVDDEVIISEGGFGVTTSGAPNSDSI